MCSDSVPCGNVSSLSSSCGICPKGTYVGADSAIVCKTVGLVNTIPSTSAAAVITHVNVGTKAGRAKRSVAGHQRIFPKDVFLQRAKEACVSFCNDLANKHIHYTWPFSGDITCKFMGKPNEDTCEDIFITDVVIFRWSYTCTPKPGIQIKGCCDIEYMARTIAVGTFPPRATNVVFSAVVLANIYDKLSADMCPFVKSYRGHNKLDTGGCVIISIGHPKKVKHMPAIEELCDACGTISKWIVCANIGDTDTVICHPGATHCYTTNRLIYNVNKIRMLNTNNKKMICPNNVKGRKKMSTVKDTCFPLNIDEIICGPHEGIRYIVAFGVALAEFELAKGQNRDVSVVNAMGGYDLDPFVWDGKTKLIHVIVLWQSPDGKYHLQTCKLQTLLSYIYKCN